MDNTMKKGAILFILFALCSLNGFSQKNLVFEPSTWDFGTIAEVDGRVSHTFTGVNRGDKPLVILDVVTSCGCTAPQFSRQPILPGGKTQITVTYDPANRPGVFSKELHVYSSERKRIATLTVAGNVTPRPKSLEELYPVDAGEGLRLTTTLNAFAYLQAGISKQGAIGYVNDSRRTIRLELRPTVSSGLLRLDYPRQIAPGERGSINVSYLNPADNPRYGTIRDALEIYVNGRTNATSLVTHGIGVDALPEIGEKARPQCEYSENILKFGTVKHAESLRRLPLTISNTGTGELIVRAVEGEGHVATTLAPGLRLAPGESFRAEVMLDPGTQDYGLMSEHFVVVTNDPVRPMRRIRVTAIIEE